MCKTRYVIPEKAYIWLSMVICFGKIKKVEDLLLRLFCLHCAFRECSRSFLNLLGSARMRELSI